MNRSRSRKCGLLNVQCGGESMELAEDMFIYYVVTDQGVVRAVSLNVRPKDPH